MWGAEARGRLAALRWPLIAAAYFAAWLLFDRLLFPVARDELHFWPTALRFSEKLVPDLELLRNYPELNTPLPFLLWGWLEHLFHGGIVVGRYLNFFLSIAMACFVARGSPDDKWEAALATAGLLAFPYYVGIATHLYTDILAALFALLGVHWHLNGRYRRSALAFILGIAARQYILVFPAALFALSLLRRVQGRAQETEAILSPLVACLSILGWFLLFGGFAPPGETAKQALATAAPLKIYVDHALFSLTMVGLYYVLPELLLYRGTLAWTARAIPVILLLVATFVAFPPLRNVVIADTFGYTDIAVRSVLPDQGRIALYCVLAALGTVRFLHEPLPLLLVATNAAVMLKAHVAWEKYALPLLLILWYLRSRGLLGGSPRFENAPVDGERPVAQRG